MGDIELADFDDLFLEDPETNTGLGEGAYVKREVLNFRPIYNVYDTEGQLLAQASSRHQALLMIRRNDLTPYDAH